MKPRLKRWLGSLLSLSLLLLLFFLPGPPWSSRVHHMLNRVIVKAEMSFARWGGHEPRLLSLSGKLDVPGALVQALDSRSGWAALADNQGRFVLLDVMWWYPRASYDLVVSTNEEKGELVKVTAPERFPESGVFDIGQVNLNQSSEAQLAALPGVASITYQDYDARNNEYYKELFDKLTAGSISDEEKISAINDYVGTKRNPEETQWELGSPRRTLETGSGSCGHMSAAMRMLLATGSYKAREIHLSDGKTPPATHAVVEVFYGGEWHLYDPTFGVKFLNQDGQVASYKEVRLDTTLITEDLFERSEPRKRGELAALLTSMYRTGFHHFYCFKDK